MKQLKIRIKNTQRKITINKKALTCLAKQVLKIKGLRDTELSILFVGKRRIRGLNKRYRGIDRVTDVLAFSMREGTDANLHPQILGDVVICPEIAQESAKVRNTTRERELYLYLIHGILHLLNYDDSNKKGRLLMEKEQSRLLKKLTE